MKNSSYKFLVAFFLIIVVFSITSGLFASALLPNCDEAWFTLPAYNLAENGFFGTTVLDESATFRQVRLDGINRFTYWIMPLYPLSGALWGKIVGFGLLQTRFFSFVFGLLALLSWTYLIKKLAGDSTVALLAAGLMAVDFHFVSASTIGRMDMMTAALGVAALAVFVRFRERNFDLAVVFSFVLAALAFFAHPLGLLWFVSLSILIVSLDFKRIKFRHVVFAALPYLFFGALWAIYILQNPDLFFLQFSGNASDRWGFFRSPLTEFWREIRDRYFYNFGVGEGLSKSGQIKILILAAYLFALVGVLSTLTLRKQFFSKFILLLAAQEFVMLLLLDGMRQRYYLIHITPTLIVISAVWLRRLWQKTLTFKILSLAVLSLVVLINLSVIFSRVKQDAYRSSFLETANFLNQMVQPNDKITASAEFWFALPDRRENLTDDFRLGFRSGRKADFIVMDAARYRDWANLLVESDAENYRYIADVLEKDCELVFENKNYQVYKRK